MLDLLQKTFLRRSLFLIFDVFRRYRSFATRTSVKFIFLALVTGCTTVNIFTTDDSRPTIERSFGKIEVHIAVSDNNASVVSSDGFGILRTPTSFTAGYWRERSAFFTDTSLCKTIIWVEDERQLQAIQESLFNVGHTLNSLCIVNGDKK